ncbi:MAG: hypothetical protein UU16_C0057G0015 [Candidatus Woesebacteria bacterium GW2011_GWA2_40_7]|uniref:Plasmid stabilization system n=3 Tax=Candidatus Woeseibacteriota TaxID=1752722 RepID=A0A0G0UU83_9BACT|nr:MAG: hypothetical protein UT17_C0001G0133 [Candidatus Woesebacteria bacterium GW2011_GWB1_39_10]KKR71649.1 MAG: hypothetical protein UU16_C0057G0015 [Candidatus Woesebacteria bacterium GW2011_GWA2_40_7]KKR92319.1 MAG: hypothetical protein UU42_C0002G0133 [Candidatus Woesebacteria bacterium GW2011_GWA1_41_13b]
MYRIVLSENFQKELKKNIKKDPKLWSKVVKTLKFLSKDINHLSLRLHKLSGKENWSISVSKSYRIMFNIENDILFCAKFGTHDEVY